MRLLQKIILDSIGEYLPGLDKEQLRVDVLKGRCSLENVDCTPGPVLAFDNFPFQLVAGRIGSLELKVPWKSLSTAPVRITAQNVSLRFEEVSFPSRVNEVLAAFRTAKRRRKLRNIADGEKRVSMISRLLQKLLPLFLNHLEVDFADVSISLTLASGYHVSLHFDRIATSDNRESSSDLSKVLQISSVSVDVFEKRSAGSEEEKEDFVELNSLPGFWRKHNVFFISKLDLCLRFDGGAVAVIFDIPCAIILSLHDVLIDLLASMKTNCVRWKSVQSPAIVHSRPKLRPEQDPKAWFQYAAREITSSKRGGGLKALSEEYKSLHLRRLTVSHRLRPTEDDRITELEEKLDIGTILALRNQASNEILVDEAATFATGDLLSRWLFGNQLTGEREIIALEIRQSLESLERFSQDFGSSADNVNASLDSRSVGNTWTKAIVTIRVQRIQVDITHGSSSLRLSFIGLKAWAEVDSSLSSYAGVLILDDVTLRSGSTTLLQRISSGTIGTGMLAQWQPASCCAPPLGSDVVCTLQMRKMFLDHAVTVSASVAALRLDLNIPHFTSLVRYVKYAQNEILTIHPSSMSQPIVKESGSRPTSDAAGSSSQRSGNPSYNTGSFIYHFNFAGCTASVTLPGGNGTTSEHVNVLCVDIQQSVVDIEVQKGIRMAKIRTRLGVGGGKRKASNDPVQSNGVLEQIMDEVPLVVSYQKKSFDVAIGTVNVHLATENAEICASFVAFCVRQFQQSSLLHENIVSSPGNASVEVHKPVPIGTCGIPRISLRMDALTVDVDAEHAPRAVCITLKCISGIVEAETLIQISARDFILSERNNRAAVQVFPVTADDHGLSLRYSATGRSANPSEPNSKSSLFSGISLTAGNASILGSPSSISRVLDIFSIYAKHIVLLVRFWQSNTVGEVAVTESNPQEFAVTKISVEVKVLSVELATEDIRAFLRAEACEYNYLIGKHTGSFQTVEVLDLSNKSGNYYRAVETSVQDTGDAVNEKCVTFTVGEGDAVIHLSGLHAVLLRSFVDELLSVISSVVDIVQMSAQELNDVVTHSRSPVLEAETTIMSDSESSGPQVIEEPQESNGNKVVIEGKFLKITAPVHRSSFGALRMSLPEAMVSFLGGSQVAKFRKASLLTRPAHASPHVSVASSSQATLTREWNVLIRSLDLDLSHKEQSFYQEAFQGVERPTKSRSQWSFDILSQVAVLLAPSQISLIRASIFQLFPQLDGTRSESNLDGRSKCSTDVDRSSFKRQNHLPANEVDVHPVCDHLLIDVGTEVISVDLLEEGDQGSVVAAIASISFGPCWYALESIQETNSSSNSTRVTRNVLDIHSLWVEDRRQGVPRHRELVLAIQAPSNLRQSFFKREDSEMSSSSIHIESLRRFENGEEKLSSKLLISEPLLCFCPELIVSLTNFFTDSISAGEIGHDGSTASSGTIVDDDAGKTDGDEQRNVSIGPVPSANTAARHMEHSSEAVSYKYSISITQPTVFIPFRSVLKEKYGLKLTSSGVKASVLVGKDGCIIRDSTIRGRNIHVSMPQQGDTAFQTASTMCSSDAFHNFRADDEELPMSQPNSSFAYESPSDYAIAFNRGRKPPSLYVWGRMEDCPAVSTSISGVIAKLPTTDDECWGISIAGISIESELSSFLHFLLLFERLAIVPELAEITTASQPMSSSPPVDLSVRNIAVHVLVPLAGNGAGAKLHNFRLRLRGAVRLRFGRDMAFISSRIRVSADVLNEDTGIRDQLLAPCDVKLKVDTVSSRLSITVPMSIQVTVSPVTVRTVTLVAVLTKNFLRRRNQGFKPDSLPTPGVVEEEKSTDGTEIFVNIRGIVTSLVSQEPRAQLMRFVFRDIRACTLWVTEEWSWGSFEFEVGDMLLEDVISWRVFGNEAVEDDPIEWATMFSGTADVSHRSSRFQVPQILPASSSPPDPRKPFLQPGSFDHEKQQMSCPIPTEDLSIDESLTRASPERKTSFLSVFSKWEYPSQHVSVQVEVGALDFHLNSAILPSTVVWIGSIYAAVADVLRTNVERNAFPHPDLAEDRYYDAPTPICIDNFVVEPITIRIATKAPPRPIEQSAFRRLLDWLIGSDFMSGLTVETTRISFGGEFIDLPDLFSKLRAEYFNALMSRYMIGQLFMQVPALSSLTRVGASTMLRRIRVLVGTANESSAPSEVSRSTYGLATALVQYSGASDYQDSSMVGELHFTKADCVIMRIQPFHDDGTQEIRADHSSDSVQIVDITGL